MKKAHQRVLLSFIGNQDPYSEKDGQKREGPLLSFLRVRNGFDRIILYHTAVPDRAESIDDLKQTIRSLYDWMLVESHPLPIGDVTNHAEIMRHLKPCMQELSEKQDGSVYFICLSSGTPAMHACWILLAASGEIPSTILYKRDERYVTKDQPLIAEIKPVGPEFPRILPHTTMIEAPPDISRGDREVAAIRELGIVGDHPKWIFALKTAVQVAKLDRPVLILGENGTGKDVIARLIHVLSLRPGHKGLISLNCGAIPVDLVESELFGHKKGAYTSAFNDRLGKFDEAHEGTLFLDEIGEMPLAMQVKILRTLQNGEIQPVGHNESHRVDVRVIAATNKDINKAIELGQFRQDLYYRLSTFIIQLPPLRERRSDIPKLALHFMDEFNKRTEKWKSLTPEALKLLQEYNWPGNVRELGNVVYRSAQLAPGDHVAEADIQFDRLLEEHGRGASPEPHEGFSLKDYIDGETSRLYRGALEIADGNMSKAAKLLGVSPASVSQFFKKHG